MSRIAAQPLTYGLHPEQRAELYLPTRRPVATVCLLHGGFWRHPYGRDQFDPLAAHLVARGLAVGNLGYRRLGAGGGWPITLDDAIAGVAHVAGLPGIDGPHYLVGHSAGGQLALVAARSSGVPLAGVAALAPLADLRYAHAAGIGIAELTALLGGAPAQVPDHYRQASPIEQLPLSVPRLLLHGTADDLVPIEVSRRYAAAAHAVGDRVELCELPGVDHMAFLDPASTATERLLDWLTAPR